MDNKKPQVGSSSSLTSQLFGSPESSSSNDVLASIFPPKGTGRNSNEPSGNQPWNTKQDDTYKHGDATYGSLSSSLYYGGRESYAKSPTNQTSTSYPKFKKDGGEDDPSGASRGNWWQGSLYY
ncbi:hypothetical protein BVRB_7g173070 [Beta vulgaris subsp. vulgaris]|uniref:uncharacterized protein LOC104900035 n=1 Tax=Beta vulgaris subsp. vulgaris TaxID=3555 RepID=UPI00053F6522|nr:uncharacterized protein LOC104900035 [Beta vulgaris subsp. vulgaris]KMT05159.1 hypothetical protein BVRB_7g173070 [Beta vulgaris subsp. vulgaris]